MALKTSAPPDGKDSPAKLTKVSVRPTDILKSGKLLYPTPVVLLVNTISVIAPSVVLVSKRAVVVIVSELFGVIRTSGLAAKPEPPSIIITFLILPLVIVATFILTPVPVPPNLVAGISIISFG